MSEGHWKVLKVIGEVCIASGSIILGAEKLLRQILFSDDGGKKK